MSHFKFLHAADLHLDSPLIGLASKSADFAGQIERASRQAFDNLINLAIEEQVAFLVLAGDVFDGDLRNYQTGLYFTAAMRRLENAGVRVFLIAGNHDAENRYAAKLRFSANVHLFTNKGAESVAVEDLGVVVHGRSFAQRDVTENLARDYPAPASNRFNIGVLHTACVGSEGHHAVYAPCSPEQLINHGYDYWALGHVHARAMLNEQPHIVYPGNLQGRNPRETGAKGATLVEVSDGQVVACEHRDLDVVRWAQIEVDLSRAEDRGAVLLAIRNALIEPCGAAADRPIALRLRLIGASALHGEFILDATGLREDIEAVLAGCANEIWLEKLELKTSAPARPETVDPTIGGQLQTEIRALGVEAPRLLEACLADIRAKMPANARVEELFAQLRADGPERAVQLALSLVGEGDPGHAV
jgi:DNA repair exonuclease SbcCD nuclease subunit